jgi:integrase
LERVFQHMNTLQLCAPDAINPARLLIQRQTKKSRNDATSFYDADKRAAISSYLENRIGRKKGDAVAVVEESGKEFVNENTVDLHKGMGRLNGKAGIWKNARDHALLAVFMGAGLRVHEAASLTISCISVEDASITLQTTPHARGNNVTDGDQAGTFARVIPIEPFALPALKHWLTLRTENTRGEIAFPSSLPGSPMDPSTVFRRVRMQLEGLGVANDKARTCCQTLRNCYIATLFDRATPYEEIARRAGFVELVSVVRFERAYLHFLGGSGQLSNFPEDYPIPIN